MLTYYVTCILFSTDFDYLILFNVSLSTNVIRTCIVLYLYFIWGMYINEEASEIKRTKIKDYINCKLSVKLKRKSKITKTYQFL